MLQQVCALIRITVSDGLPIVRGTKHVDWVDFIAGSLMRQCHCSHCGYQKGARSDARQVASEDVKCLEWIDNELLVAGSNVFYKKSWSIFIFIHLFKPSGLRSKPVKSPLKSELLGRVQLKQNAAGTSRAKLAVKAENTATREGTPVRMARAIRYERKKKHLFCGNYLDARCTRWADQQHPTANSAMEGISDCLGDHCDHTTIHLIYALMLCIWDMLGVPLEILTSPMSPRWFILKTSIMQVQPFSVVLKSPQVFWWLRFSLIISGRAAWPFIKPLLQASSQVLASKRLIES